MSLGALLGEIRETYVARLRETALRAPKAIVEPVLRDADGRVAREGDLQLGMRIDLVHLTVGEERSESVDSHALVRFEPLSFDWSGVVVELRPFFWDAMSLELRGIESSAAAAPLRAWFQRWIRVDDDVLAEPPLVGAVHFLSDPSVDSDGCVVQVDLGSAPIAAFEELLDVGATLGAKRVVISSRAG